MLLIEFQKHNYNLEQIEPYNLYLQECSKKDYSNQATQRHHILPVSMGGSNDSKNFITLNLQDHFQAHVILGNCFPNGSTEKKKNLASCKLIMTYVKKYMRDNNHIVSDDFQEFWDYVHTVMYEFNSGENNHFYGKTHTEESRKKIKEARAKQVFSEETKQKFKEKLLSLPNTQKGEINPNYGKTWEDMYLPETIIKLREIRAKTRKTKLEKLPEGYFPCDLIIDGVQKSYYRYCPDCNCKIYHVDPKHNFSTLISAKKRNTCCKDCQKNRPRKKPHIPDKTAYHSNYVIIKDKETGIIYNTIQDASNKLSISRTKVSKMIKLGKFEIIKDCRTAKNKS